MLNPYYQFFVRIIHSLYSRTKWAIILLLLVWCASCSSGEAADIKLQLNVQSGGRPGLYSVTGTTNLPEQSQITVAAIRYLNSANQPLLSFDKTSNYSILDRQLVRVEKGKWQATLTLWQVAPDGRFQETWQLNQFQINTSVEPSPEVSFVATFEPDGQLATAKNQNVQTPELEGSLVRFTNEGQPYVKSSQTLRIPLPTGRKTPPIPKPEDINGGWGDRYELKPEPPLSKNTRPTSIKSDQTNAPLSPSEFMR
ncbi:MAG TPA: hypothetical protein DCL61_30775 [Cyanobacteria bacterium UBA12227]|nr:hypothetical protein [Cyanobacteria bacterium UBA12227]HAX84689.1 hypothetical protein [Cyanobacteria bacterium UBA11370]HBY79103.1 hypothetical protein [Cyanobacteria bacterium UBA11148]